MRVFLRTHLRVRRHTYVMVRAEDQACTFAREEVLYRCDLVGRSFLFGDHVVQAEDHERVGVSEDAFINRQSLASLVYSLINGDGLSRHFTNYALETDK